MGLRLPFQGAGEKGIAGRAHPAKEEVSFFCTVAILCSFYLCCPNYRPLRV
jgi:hypothetical protein